jgi:CRP/FNR family transcriptional regulator, cyclic AMP receptor protein
MRAPEASGFIGVLSGRDRDALAAIGHQRRYRKGAVILLEGDHSNHVLLLREGRVKVTSTTPDGRELLLAVRGPGEFIGELAALAGEGEPRSATVTAMDPLVAQVIFTAEFLDYFERNPRALLALTRTIIRRLSDADRRRIEYGSYDARGRIARVLVEIAEQHGKPGEAGIEIGLALSQEELAGLVAASRESVARSLTTLRRRGLLTTGRRSIVILDLEGLRRYCV